MTEREPSGERPATGRVSARDRFFAGVVSCGGLGYAPVASGTFGTLGAVLLVICLIPLRGESWFHFGGAMGLLAALALLVGVPLGRWAERHYGSKDPKQFVLDELAGYWVTLLRFGEGFPGFQEIFTAFLAFRLFDVVKPPPGRRLEHLRGGWGIMLDDIVAGIYAHLLVWVLRQELGWP